MYKKGEGVTQNYAKAIEYYEFGIELEGSFLTNKVQGIYQEEKSCQLVCQETLSNFKSLKNQIQEVKNQISYYEDHPGIVGEFALKARKEFQRNLETSKK